MLVYHAVDAAREASKCEALFARNGWLGAWVDGIYSFHHFHSTRHEVLANIRAVPLPDADPVQGPDGPLTAIWPAAA